VYSADLPVFWAAISTAGGLTALLSLEPNEVDALGGRFRDA
jgi:hypothetical protein